MTLAGMDVSSYQTTTPPLAGMAFAFARATYDVTPDTLYPMHAANIAAAGVVVGAYHFGTGRSTPQAQADAFLGAASGAGLLALDLENDGVPMTNDQAAQFIQAVHAKGRKCGLYHSLSGFPTLGQDFHWIASWGANDGSAGTPPPTPWTFWQYTSRGSVAGYVGDLDLDQFNGTAAGLAALAGGAMGLVVNLSISPDAIGTAVMAGAHQYIRISDRQFQTALPAGASLGPCQKGSLTAPLDANPGDRTSVVVFNRNGEMHAAMLMDVTFTPLPPTFSQADIDAATRAATIAGKRSQYDLDAAALVTPLGPRP